MRTRQILRTTLALSVVATALTASAWALEPACQLDKFKITSYSSEVDTYHHKLVIAYCVPDYKAISCEAKTFVTSEYGNTSTATMRVMKAARFRWFRTISMSPTLGRLCPSASDAQSKPVPARFRPMRMSSSSSSESEAESP